MADKVKKVMHEFKAGTLHSGSKKGPKVTNRKQAVAIALSEARKAGENVPRKRARAGGKSMAKNGAPRVPRSRRVSRRTKKGRMGDGA